MFDSELGSVVFCFTRYTHYFSRILRLRRLGLPPLPSMNPVLLTTIRLHGIPKYVLNKDLWFTIVTKNSKLKSKGQFKPSFRIAEDYILFTGNGRTGIAALDDDVKMEFFYGKLLICFDCSFLVSVYLRD